MAGKRKLLNRVEDLLINLLNEAEIVEPAVVNEDGIELKPARVGATFGERLKLAEVATQFEIRRAKVAEDETPSELEQMRDVYHGNAAPERRSSRKTRAPESNGIANAGRALGAFIPANGEGGG